MFSRKMILLTFLVTTMVSGAYAQNRFEIEPFAGARFGGRITINTPDVDYLPIDSSLNWGFTTGVGIVPHLFGEFMFNRQTTTLSAHDRPTTFTKRRIMKILLRLGARTGSPAPRRLT